MTVDAAAGGAFRERMRAEQVDILYGHILVSQASNLLVATLLVWFLSNYFPPRPLLSWWAAIAVLVLLRLAMFIAYKYRPADSSVPWHALMTGTTAVSGVVWGGAGVMFFLPDSAAVLTCLTVTLAGMSAGTIASHSAWAPAQFPYAILATTPISLRYLTEDGDIWMLGVMGLIYLLAVLLFARQLSATLVESIRLRLEKQELVGQLQAGMTVADEARARAEEANLAKSRFLAAASHDLRQPLQAVNLLIEVLRNEKEPGRAEKVLENLGASAQSLEELLNELLDISKLEAGLFKPQIKVLTLQDIFDGLERELRPVAEKNGIELGFVGTRLRIVSDSNMLGRILRNIITNAINYTQRGAVLVGCRRRSGGVAITVCDTGPGIAPEHRQAIFREFYQIGNPERDRRKGLGLGLAIVDGLCRVLEHPLALRSEIGRGSTFMVHVPVSTSAEVDAAEAEPGAALDLRDHAVLVIDDEPSICQAMADVLGGWGCLVRTAESAREAIAALAADGFVPDAIIADYRLREGRTGGEAIAEVRAALGRFVPAVIVTGDTAPERLREASASDLLLLHKPLKPARLRAALLNLWSSAGRMGDAPAASDA